MQKIEFIADKTEPLFDAILKQKPNLNYQQLSKVLRKKDIKINGKRAKENILLNPQDIVCLYLPDKKTKTIEIVYQDDNILIAFKPQGMEVTKADKVFVNSDCLEDVFEGSYACHRIDKNTEGLVVMAKNTKARDLMFDCFKNNNIQKKYMAVAYGKIQADGQTFVDYHKKEQNKVYVFSSKQNGTSKIITIYKVLKCTNELHILSIEIKTGKTHQIRAQLAHHGIYIVGDERYGNKVTNKKYGCKKQLLCANELKFYNLPPLLKNLSNKTISATPTFLSRFEFNI